MRAQAVERPTIERARDAMTTEKPDAIGSRDKQPHVMPIFDTKQITAPFTLLGIQPFVGMLRSSSSGFDLDQGAVDGEG